MEAKSKAKRVRERDGEKEALRSKPSPSIWDTIDVIRTTNKRKPVAAESKMSINCGSARDSRKKNGIFDERSNPFLNAMLCT